MHINSHKYISKAAALKKLERYCIYQDRCQQEVKNKLASLKIYGSDADQVLIELIQHNFVNEERFAKAFVSGRYKLKRWGKKLIIQKLKQKQISEFCINIGLKQINENLYLENLKFLIHKKIPTIKTSSNYKLKNKLANYMVGKGYEQDLVWQTLNELL